MTTTEASEAYRTYRRQLEAWRDHLDRYERRMALAKPAENQEARRRALEQVRLKGAQLLDQLKRLDDADDTEIPSIRAAAETAWMQLRATYRDAVSVLA